MKLWSILGNSQKLDGGAMFGNAPKALWSKWLAPDENNCVPLACRALLVDDLDGKTVLFETALPLLRAECTGKRYRLIGIGFADLRPASEADGGDLVRRRVGLTQPSRPILRRQNGRHAIGRRWVRG